MSRPRKLTADQVLEVSRVSAKRRELLALLKALPTFEQLADRWNVSVSVLKQASARNTYRDVPRESD